MSAVVRLGLIGCGAIGTVLLEYLAGHVPAPGQPRLQLQRVVVPGRSIARVEGLLQRLGLPAEASSDSPTTRAIERSDRKGTRLNSSRVATPYAVSGVE